MPSTATLSTEEAPLQDFLARLPEEARLPARTLAHSWQGGGGTLRVGRVAVRLLGDDGGTPFTAATLHAPGREGRCLLELCRALLHQHGMDEDQWTHWSDELAELEPFGFDPHVKFPTLPVDGRLSAHELVRLANGLRDLARLTAGS